MLCLTLEGGTMEIAGYEVEVVELGTVALDGGAMFGVVPRTLWQKQLEPDALNRVHLALRVLLLRGHGRCVLVDTGVGASWSDRDRGIYGIEAGQTVAHRALAGLGVAPDDVTDVLLTHLHFDHAGGAVVRAEDGALAPAFPAARYHVQAANLAWARAPTERDRASYRPDDFEPLARAGCLVEHEGPGELFEGVRVRVSNGHTTGLQIPVVSDGATTLIYPADLVPTRAHVPTAWGMAYDLRPLEVMEEKKALLEEAAQGGWIVVYEHDPDVAATRIAVEGGRLRAADAVDVSRSSPRSRP
jgi:glyoxylase-like metal-dependent hydrolase (beta-lactamase superfamily II)